MAGDIVAPAKVQRLVRMDVHMNNMEMENNLKSIVYVTVNTVNQKIYVGVHITENPYKFDNYWGCGIKGTTCDKFLHPKTPFQKACKKYGLDAFRRYTLFVFDTYEEALEMEKQIVNEEFVRRKDTYNAMVGGGAGLVPACEIPIYQYDLEGNYLQEFRSIAEASRKLECSTTVFHSAIINNSTAVGFYWSRTKTDKLDVSNYVKPTSKPVYVYNTDGTFAFEMPSVAECARKLEVLTNCIYRAEAKQTKCGGFYISFEKVEYFVKIPQKRVRNKTLFQYALTGEFIAEVSYEEAHEICKNPDRLHRAIAQNYSCGGFLWSKTKVKSLKPLKQDRKKKIYQYDLDGNLIKVWDSYRECVKQYSKLREVLNGKRNHFKGFVFKYEEVN